MPIATLSKNTKVMNWMFLSNWNERECFLVAFQFDGMKLQKSMLTSSNWKVEHANIVVMQTSWTRMIWLYTSAVAKNHLENNHSTIYQFQRFFALEPTLWLRCRNEQAHKDAFAYSGCRPNGPFLSIFARTSDKMLDDAGKWKRTALKEYHWWWKKLR